MLGMTRGLGPVYLHLLLDRLAARDGLSFLRYDVNMPAVPTLRGRRRDTACRPARRPQAKACAPAVCWARADA